jgi:hypothetical protein
VPRKELFEREEVVVATPMREVCPDGLMIEIAGNTFAVDASGSTGDLGTPALEAWLAQPTGSLVVSYAGQSAVLPVRTGPAPTVMREGELLVPVAELAVPVGTFGVVGVATTKTD